MSNKYSYNSTLGRYVQSSQTYTGPHTKTTSRQLDLTELENIKIRQLERIANALELLLIDINSYLKKDVHNDQ